MYYDNSVFQTCASGLVGWYQSTDASHPTLSVQNLQSTSGLRVDSLPGINWETITKSITTVEADLNTYLERVRSEETRKLVNRAVDRIKDKLSTKELLSNFDPIAGVAPFSNLVTQNARFVGFMIMPQESENLRAEITHIGMQIDTIQVNPVKIYLYDTSQKSPIATYDYTNTKTDSLEWFTSLTDFIINYRSSSSGTGQTFLLGYYEADPNNVQTSQLSGQALYLQFGSGCCGEAKRRKLHQKYIGIVPIQIPNDKLNWDGADALLPDCESLESYTCSTTHGLFLKFNITCDISHVICMNKDMFAEPLQLAMAVRVLSDCISSTRHNEIADASQNREQVKNWMLTYKADLMGWQTEGGEWRKGMVDRLVLDVSNLDGFCLKCNFNKPVVGRANRVSF